MNKTIDVLIVDDDDNFGDLSQERLEDEGWSSVFHHGPFGTMVEILRMQPRLVILDVNMPGLRGVTLIEMIRNESMDRYPHVLLMSSCDSDQLQRHADESGAADFLSKSAGREAFVAKVGQLLDTPSAQLQWGQPPGAVGD